MTQDNAPTDPAADLPPSNPAVPENKISEPVKPKRKRRWVRRILLGIVAVVVLLVILAGITPTLLSTGAGRTFVLGKINQNLNGHVTVTDWSIGWTGGVRASDIKVFDDSNRQILQIPRFSTQLSLLSAIRGKIHLGDTRVEGLDFFAERFPDGTINFARLAKTDPHDEHEAGDAKEKEHAAVATDEHRSKLPVIDGELQLVGCRGTFQDDLNPDAKLRTVEFRTIAGDVKIASLNDPIKDTFSIVAYAGDGSQMVSFSTSGELLIAKDNELLTPGQMQITQKVMTAADLKGVQQGFGGMLPIAFKSGTIDVTLNVSNGSNGITITPIVKGENVAYEKDGVLDNVGGVYVDGTVNMFSPAGASAKDAVTNVTFSNLRAMGVGSAIVINGPIEDLLHGRKFNNVTIDLSYNLAMIWDAIKPTLTKEQKESLKDVKVAGSNNARPEHFAINGSLPADKPFNEAIKGLTASGEFALESFDGQGASLRNLTVPIALAGGKVRIAYAGKTGSQEFAPPADLNNGKFSLAGATIDLTGTSPTLEFPDKTQVMDKVELNPLFTSTFLAGNPLFADAHKSSGMLSIEIVRCHDFALGDIVMKDVPENKGVIELNLKMQKLEIGNVLVAKITQQFNGANLPFIKKLTLDSLNGDIDDFNVVVQHGISNQHLTLSFGGGKRPLKLAGTVVLATQIMDMQLDLPMALFGIKAGQDSGVKLPVSGPVNNPQFNLKEALKKNLTNIKGLPGSLKGILGDDKGATTQPADQNDNDPVKDLIKGLGKKKDNQ